MTWVDPALRELVGSGTAPPSAMASELPMPVPVCLIENTQTEGLVVQQEALRVLSELTQPVVVVAITGPYRSGKSYLMNRLARQRKGFSLGSSVQSHTKGIWMWCLPHPCQPGHTLVLLDTEGLGDVEKGDTQNDTWIFVLAILLASTIIYNSKGTIDQPAMEQLHYMVKLSDHVKLKAAPKESQDELEDSEKFVLFFPTFIWAVRDFTLQLELDGKEISADDYLENALRLKDGNSREVQRYNQTRECIRQYFPERKCFVFDQPAHKRDLVHLEELQDDEIDVEFRQQLEKFCSYIWEKSPLKTIPGGYIITGNLLGKLAETYVETIRSGAVPCLESTVVTLAETANAAAVKEAVTLYRDLMEQRVKLPTETLQELLELHKQCEQEALELFMARAFKEGICSSQTELIRQVEAVKEKFCTDNDQASRDKCEAALRDLSQVTERRISDGTYNVSGGYQLFREDQQALVEKYQELPGKGVKADAVLQEFLQSRRSLAESILSTDLSLTEKDKELKSEQEHHERAEHKREVQKKKEAEDKQKSQDRLHTCQAHTVRLRQKLEDQHAKQLTEHRRMIVHKSKEVDMLLRDGLHDKAVHLREVTYRLEEESSHITDEIMVWMRILIPILLGLAFVVLRL
ncbi:guanylate-binding protein 1-like isoform X3 [Strix uralensis]|uniref:guanylate-binding protein 1-like isoform X3 n=1 Tax=Strix uralensis TaxID=36305 RepID=UPI003DA72112